MKKLSIATLGAAFVALGTVAIAPAEAANLTKLDYSGTASIGIFGLGELPFGVDRSFVVDNLSGRLSDEGDGELTIDNPLSFFGEEFNSLFTAFGGSLDSLTGGGSISKDNVFLSSFNFFYDKVSDVFTINNYNFDNIKACLSSTCNLLGQGNFSGSVFSGFIPVEGAFNFNIDQTATPLSEASNSQSVPEPSAFLALLGVGSFLAAKRKQMKAA
ncbi:MAG TPA: PEP-CTERM sorting domain-containing protein [Leptolyngbyaceae cyanobacterium]